MIAIGRKVFDLHRGLHVHIESNVREFLSRYDTEQMRFLVHCMKDTATMSWMRFDENDEAQGGAPGTDPIDAAREAEETSEILTMLRRVGPEQASQG